MTCIDQCCINTFLKNGKSGAARLAPGGHGWRKQCGWVLHLVSLFVGRPRRLQFGDACSTARSLRIQRSHVAAPTADPQLLAQATAVTSAQRATASSPCEFATLGLSLATSE
jgi:hypothetical protein